MSRNITLSISVISALGWSLMTSGLLIATLDSVDVPVHDFGLAGVCIALIGKQVLSRNMLARVEEQVEAAADREIQAFELGRRAELTRLK